MWYCELFLENRWGEVESIVLVIFVFWQCCGGEGLLIGGWGVARWGKKSYLGPAEITSFSSRNFSRSSITYSGMLYQLDISTCYCYDPLLFLIFVPWKFIKTEALPSLLSLLQSTASHADSHFYKWIYLFQIFYSMKSMFLLTYTLRFFIFKFDLNMKHCSYFF